MKCTGLGINSLTCECYGVCGPEAVKAFSSISPSHPWEYQQVQDGSRPLWWPELHTTLVRANARAILTCSYTYTLQQVDEVYV